MTREIKFRAWNTRLKEMLEVVRLIWGKRGLESYCQKKFGFCGEVDEVELMQFTGLKDKNGKEIFEGDIVKRTWRLSYWESPTIETFVVGSKDCPFNDYKWINEFEEDDYKILDKFVEVIGNIYENPELLNGGSA